MKTHQNLVEYKKRARWSGPNDKALRSRASVSGLQARRTERRRKQTEARVRVRVRWVGSLTEGFFIPGQPGMTLEW